jgi:hypothetical protein
VRVREWIELLSDPERELRLKEIDEIEERIASGELDDDELELAKANLKKLVESN